jgi:hypothetical protein
VPVSNGLPVLFFFHISIFSILKRKHSASIKDFLHPFFGFLVGSHITLNLIFSAVCGRIDLKFGKDLQIDLLFQFLLFFS